MAVVKVYFRKSAQKLAHYVSSHGKEDDPRTGLLCSTVAHDTVDQFQAIREGHNHDGVNQALHVFQSWSPEESQKRTPEEFNAMGVELASRYFPGHQALVVTHTDTPHIHNHIVVNIVNMETGKQIEKKYHHLHKLRKINDEICLANGLTVPNQNKQRREARMPEKVQRMVRAGRNSYLMDTKQKADFARKYATNYHEYVGYLSELGIPVRIEEKNISYFYPGRKYGKRGKNFGPNYDKVGLEAQFKTNIELFSKYPGIRALVREKIGKAKLGKSELSRLISEHPAATGADHSGFRIQARRDSKFSVANESALAEGHIPVDELRKARRQSIVRYCKHNAIPLLENDDGTYALKSKPHVTVTDFEWTNTHKHTKGSIIEFVATHKKMTFLQAVADINDNPRLLLLEKYLGKQNRSYTPFGMASSSKMEKSGALEVLTSLLKSRHIGGGAGETLFRSQQVHVGKDGSVRFFAKDDETGGFEFRQEQAEKWTSKKLGSITKPFVSTPGDGRKAVVFTDPFSLIQKRGKELFSERKRNDGILGLLEPNADIVSEFMATNKQLKSIEVVVFDTKRPSKGELDFFNVLKSRHGEHGISFNFISIDKALPARGLGFDI
jgi:hypothetical protein